MVTINGIESEVTRNRDRNGFPQPHSTTSPAAHWRSGLPLDRQRRVHTTRQATRNGELQTGLLRSAANLQHGADRTGREVDGQIGFGSDEIARGVDTAG